MARQRLRLEADCFGQDARGGHLSRNRCHGHKIRRARLQFPNACEKRVMFHVEADVAVPQVCMVFVAVVLVMEWCRWASGERDTSVDTVASARLHSHNRIRQHLMMRSHSELSNARFFMQVRSIYTHIWRHVVCVGILVNGCVGGWAGCEISQPVFFIGLARFKWIFCSQKHARKHSPTHPMRQGLQGELAHCSLCCTYTESDYESNIWYRRSVAARSLAHLSLAPEAPNIAGLSCMAHSSRHAK